MQLYTPLSTTPDQPSASGPSPPRALNGSHAPPPAEHPVAESGPSDDVAFPFADISDIRNFRPSVWVALDRMYRAALLAADCESARVDFSVSAKGLFEIGLWSEELRWLVSKKILKRIHGEASSPTSSQTALPASFADSNLIITDLGIELMEQCMSKGQLDQFLIGSPFSAGDAATKSSTKPSWDTERHELNCGGKLVKKFKWRAANQEAILAAFEEDGWPAHIDDPLPQEGDVDPKRRLADAIKSLNRHQRVPLIRFCGDGTGEGVLWEFKR